MSPVIATVDVQRREGPGVDLCFSFPSTGAIVYLPLPNDRPLAAMRQKAGEYLDRVVPSVARRRPALGQAEDAFRVLLSKGRELVELLTQHDRDRVLRLQAAFRDAWPVWQNANWDDETPLPVVEVVCHEGALPLELLPMFDFGPMPTIHTDEDLRRASSRFLGFTAVVRRVTHHPLTGDHVLRTDPALPVQFFRHRARFGPRRDTALLESRNGAVRIEGPWPVRQDPAQFRAALVDALYSGRGLDGAEAGDPPVQIQHFACHCDTTSASDDDYTLTVTTRSGAKRSISLGELREAYGNRHYADGGSSAPRALIVLNACGSSRTNPATALSFPMWFLSYGHRAFIGTETDVPDGVAGAFAEALYGRLVQGEHPLGDVVVHARRDLLRDCRNPLGLLYVMYGDVDLQADRKRPEVYRRSRGSL